MQDNSRPTDDRVNRAVAARLWDHISSAWLIVARLVPLAVARPWTISAAGIALGAVSIFFVMHHFAMSTDTDKLISNTLPWRIHEKAYDALFPDDGQIIIVVDGKTPELAEEAAASL